MHLGVYMFPTDYSIQPVELATALEERGFESLFVPEHTHIPVSRRTPWPGGGPLPKEYYHTHDPLVALSFAAAATKKLTVGTSIALLPQRDAIVTAKAIASLDMLSGGRFVLGLGAGWNQDEMENHGVVYEDRFKQMEEKIQAMQAIWTQEQASFYGDHVNFGPLWSYPKPLQKPHPPILLGGETKYTMRRIVKYCDGWLPRARDNYDVLAGMSQLSQIAAEEGRDMSTVQVNVFGARSDAGVLKSYRDAGITRSILPLPSETADKILPRLDKYAALLRG
jgi:probable F420-dependent oxidoreductase